jgi:hypothetical protein
MRRRAIFCALLAALLPAGCSTTAPQQPRTPPSPPTSRETERLPGTLPDAYKHPPK